MRIDADLQAMMKESLEHIDSFVNEQALLILIASYNCLLRAAKDKLEVLRQEREVKVNE